MLSASKINDESFDLADAKSSEINVDMSIDNLIPWRSPTVIGNNYPVSFGLRGAIFSSAILLAFLSYSYRVHKSS